MTITSNGLGMSPDQILPDFTSQTDGTAFFDGSLAPYSFVIYVDVLSVEIMSLEEPTSLPALQPSDRSPSATRYEADSARWNAGRCSSRARYALVRGVTSFTKPR